MSRISPSSKPLSHEIHEVESLAIDPSNPDIVYAGTWHLPWKTTDGGKNWQSIKQGLIDDSDVFSIILDPEHPRTVFLSACSGIYKSETAGARFRKLKGFHQPRDERAFCGRTRRIARLCTREPLKDFTERWTAARHSNASPVPK